MVIRSVVILWLFHHMPMLVVVVNDCRVDNLLVCLDVMVDRLFINYGDLVESVAIPVLSGMLIQCMEAMMSIIFVSRITLMMAWCYSMNVMAIMVWITQVMGSSWIVRCRICMSLMVSVLWSMMNWVCMVSDWYMVRASQEVLFWKIVS